MNGLPRNINNIPATRFAGLIDEKLLHFNNII